MIPLPQKFAEYRPRVAQRLRAVEMAKNKVERLTAMLEYNREIFTRLSNNGVISHENAQAMRDCQNRIASLQSQVAEARKAIPTAYGVTDDDINKILTLMGV